MPTGELLTTAQWYRGFVDRHPAYQHDSVLNHEIVHDLLVTVDGIVAGTIKVRPIWIVECVEQLLVLVL